MNQFLKGLIWVCIGVIPFLAWMVSDSMFFPFITGKNFFFRVLVEIAFAAYLILAIREPIYRLKGSIMLYIYGAFMIVVGIADYIGVDSYLSMWSNYERMEGYITHIHLFAYFIVLYAFLKEEKSWNRLMGLFVAANVPVLMEGLLQLLGRPEFIFAKWAPTLQPILKQVYSVHMSDSLRLDSSLGNAAYYGIYTLFNLIFAILLIVKAEKFNKSFLDIMLNRNNNKNNSKENNNKNGDTKNDYTKIKLLWEKLKFNFKGILHLITLMLASLVVLYSNYATVKQYGSSSAIYIGGMVALLISVYYFAKDYNNSNIGKGVLGLIALFNLTQLYYTQTRGSYLGLIGGVLVAILLIVLYKVKKSIGKKVKNTFTQYALTLISFLLVITIVGGGIYNGAKFVSNNKESTFVKNNVVLNRLATINIINPITGYKLVKDKNNNYEELNDYFGDITIVSRFLNAKIAIEGWTERPWFGFGQENYKNIFDKHFDPRMYSQEAWFDRTHNVFFDWLVAAGAMGLVFYLALYLTPYYIMWLGRNKDKFSLAEKSAISGLLVAYFIHNIFVFDNLISYILFFMLLAYVGNKATMDVESKNEFRHVHLQEKTKIILSSAIGLILLLSLYFVNWLPYSTNLALFKGLQYSEISRMIANQGSDPTAGIKEVQKTFTFAINNDNFGKLEAVEQYITKASEIISIQTTKSEFTKDLSDAKMAIVTDAFTTMDNHIASNTLSARTLTIYAGSLAQLGLYDKALIIIDKALAVAPKKQILLNFRAQLLMMLNRKQEAYDTAKAAYILDPTYKTSEDLLYNTAGESKNGKDLKATLDQYRYIKQEKVNINSQNSEDQKNKNILLNKDNQDRLSLFDEKLFAVYVQSKMATEAIAMLTNARRDIYTGKDAATIKSIASATSTKDFLSRLKTLETEMYKTIYKK